MKLTGEERRNKILSLLRETQSPLSGSALAERLGVSRQVIVTDIALLRASRSDIIATNAGYLLAKSADANSVVQRRIFKVNHTDEQIAEELTAITDLGGSVIDVYIDHKVYGTLSAPMNIRCRRDVQHFLDDLKSGVSTPLKNITHGYHYHTVEAASSEILDEIEEILRAKGFLLEVITEKPIYRAKTYSA
ncbi:MAG: transcription repressor NadR [Treponema sp.]|nr:transcription repressor NadR [Treponema sp.]